LSLRLCLVLEWYYLVPDDGHLFFLLEENRRAGAEIENSHGIGHDLAHSETCGRRIRSFTDAMSRDVERVNEDLQVLAQFRVIKRAEDGAVPCPPNYIHLDMVLKDNYRI
jgi:hypothetical protein